MDSDPNSLGALPRAWIGYAPFKKGEPLTVRICAWCPDKKTADALAEKMDLKITHSICPACYQAENERKFP